MADETREQQLMEEFKAGLDKDGPIVLAQRVAELEGQVATLTAAQSGLEEDVERERQRADTAELARDAAEKSEKAATGKLRTLSTPKKPRALGVLSDDKNLSGDDLRKAIADADDIEIVFSDGKREVGVPPVAVEGAVWKDHPFGLLLDRSVDIEGPDGAGSISITGYALLLDGKQVAWRERSMPLQVAPGQRVQITEDILF